jgi:hypothetical protein
MPGRSLGLVCVGSLVALVTIGCGGGAGGDPGAGAAGAGGADASSLFAHGPANLCASVTNAADQFLPTATTATYQDTAQGGLITPGLYWLTTETVFESTLNPPLIRDTSYFYGDGTFQAVFESAGSSTPTINAGTWAIVGTTLHLSEICPTTSSPVDGFTATDTQLTLFVDDNKAVAVYTRH